MFTNNCKTCGVEQLPRVIKRPFGMDDMILEPAEYCDSCQDKIDAETAKKTEEAAHAAEIQRANKFSNIPPLFKDASFENLTRNEANKKAFEACKAFKPIGESILLYGGTGTGKTHLGSAIINEYIGKTTALFIPCPELLDQLRKSYKTETKVDLFEYAKTAKILVLDDLGVESPSDWVKERLYLLINHRYLNQLSTIITTNSTQSELVERLGIRIVSRLSQMCQFFKIDDTDHRLLKKKQKK